MRKLKYVIFLIFFTHNIQAVPMTATFFDRITHIPTGTVQWEVFGSTAVIDLALSIPNASIISFAFNTNLQNDPCGGGCTVPPAPDTGRVINDAALNVSVRGIPAATVRLDGTDGYDWDMYNFSVQSMTVDISGLPLIAMNADIAIYNNLIAEVFELGGEFGIGVDYAPSSSVWSYTNLAGFATNESESNIPEPGTLALLGLGLVGLGFARRKKA